MSDEAQDKSIISEKYRERYKPDNRDWLGSFIDEGCTNPVTKEREVKDDEGNVTGTETVTLKKRTLDIDALFDLAEANAIPAREKYGDQVDRKNAAGRLRMTIGNMLRAAARKRHGLYDTSGKWVKAPAEFIGDAEKTENKDGSKIAKKVDEAVAA